MELYTIGFTRKSLREFVRLLQGAQVDGVVDIRLNNTSQLAGYAKRDDLAFVLELCGIGYYEEKRLAPRQDLLDTYHSDHDWPAYEVAFNALLAEQPLADILAEISGRYQRPCLLCAEPEPSKCHRRLVAEACARIEPRLCVTHLVAPAQPTKTARTTASGSAAKGIPTALRRRAAETSEKAEVRA